MTSSLIPPPQVPVLYPFGHCLSYTTFRHSGIATELPEAAPPLERHRDAALLHVSLSVANSGGMEADEVVLLFLPFPEDLQRQHQQRQPVLLPSAAADPPAAHLALPCTDGRLGGAVWPEDVPVQTLAGFSRVAGLAPGQAADVRFALALRDFQPFSPLGSDVRGGPGSTPAVLPYCRDYLLRTQGGQQLVLRLEGSDPPAGDLFIAQ